LLEFCGLIGTLIMDEDGDYDPGLANGQPAPWREGDNVRDGAFSLTSTRSIEALRQKARRGELLLTVAVGCVRANDGRIEKDPNFRVKDGIALVFRKFGELQTDRRVLIWFQRQSAPSAPLANCGGAQRQ
jgi:hypothetical protein